MSKLEQEMLTALQSCLAWMEHTIPKLHATCPHCEGRVDVGGLNWGGPINKARTAIANAYGETYTPER
jgi:tRNA G26 N,N-dimethylase Trm1